MAANLFTVKMSIIQRNQRIEGYKRMIGGLVFYCRRAPGESDLELQGRAAVYFSQREAQYRSLRQAGLSWPAATPTSAAMPFPVASSALADITPTPMAPVAPTTPQIGPNAITTKGKTVNDGLDAYLEALKAKGKGRAALLIDTNSLGMVYRLDKLRTLPVRLNGQTRVFGEMPLAEVNAFVLGNVVSHFIARPNHATRNKSMAVQTCINIIKACHSAFDHCDRTELWLGPRRWEDAFSFDRKGMRTMQEKKKPKNDTFTIDELRTLWHLAWPQARLYMGLGLFTGSTQMELATLMLDDVIIENGETYIDRLRHKTDCQGRWWIPPQIATLLHKRIAETPKDETANPQRLAFLTNNNLPLIHMGKKAMCDSVRLVWNMLLDRAQKHHPVRRMGFKYLRKTGASMIERISDSELMAQTFLAHNALSTAGKHYLSLSERIKRLEPHCKAMAVELNDMLTAPNRKAKSMIVV